MTERPEVTAEIEREKADSQPGPVWICFHCGFETADEAEASEHFGTRDDAEPFCVMWSQLSEDERAQECLSGYSELERERAENLRLMAINEAYEYRLETMESAILSRFRIKSLEDVWSEYHSMQGRALAAEARLRSIRKALLDGLVPEAWS